MATRYVGRQFSAVNGRLKEGRAYARRVRAIAAELGVEVSRLTPSQLILVERIAEIGQRLDQLQKQAESDGRLGIRWSSIECSLLRTELWCLAGLGLICRDPQVGNTAAERKVAKWVGTLRDVGLRETDRRLGIKALMGAGCGE